MFFFEEFGLKKYLNNWSLLKCVTRDVRACASPSRHSFGTTCCPVLVPHWTEGGSGALEAGPGLLLCHCTNGWCLWH